jgi:hypothetical protein
MMEYGPHGKEQIMPPMTKGLTSKEVAWLRDVQPRPDGTPKGQRRRTLADIDRVLR